jgi:hypothetical protein
VSGLPLADIQRLLWDLIAAPEGVGPGLAALRREGRLPVADLSEVVRGDQRLAAQDRLDIYASMYFYRLRDALAEDFPRTAAVAGGARFHNLVTDYLLAHPSRHWSLRHLGDGFAGFLAGHELGRIHPWLADLARLEWARIEVFDAADVPVLTREQAAAAGPELRLRLVPAARLLTVAWSVAPLWLALAGEEGGTGAAGTSAAVSDGTGGSFPPPVRCEPPRQQAGGLLVWRRQTSVLHRSLPPDERAALDALATGGAGLPELGALLAERAVAEAAADAVAEATARLAGLLAGWLQDGLLAEE